MYDFRYGTRSEEDPTVVWTVDGTEFAAWWRLIADVYRREFYGCKIGFPAMSPGAAIVDKRTEEGAFVTQAKAAVAAADWVGVHYYWERADGSDINPPSARWRSWSRSWARSWSK